MEKQLSSKITFDDKREKLFHVTLSKYPTKEAALLPVLWLAMDQFGSLSNEILEYVAGRLGLSPVRVFAVSEFYTMFHREPVGGYHIQLCRNLSCSLMGSEDIQAFLEEKLGIKPGGKTDDGAFSLELVECLGSCGTAPVMRVNDTYFENLTVERTGKLIEACLAGKLPEPGKLPESGEAPRGGNT